VLVPERAQEVLEVQRTHLAVLKAGLRPGPCQLEGLHEAQGYRAGRGHSSQGYEEWRTGSQFAAARENVFLVAGVWVM
jgi:hypothetical protein